MQITGAAVAAIVAFSASVAPGVPRLLRYAAFDGYQALAPRERTQNPVIIVAIDEAALAAYGQWPWPRDRLAELIEKIGAQAPRAVGLDLVLPEQDRLSPENIAQRYRRDDPGLADRLSRLPANDDLLGAALTATQSVLGVALLDGDPGNGGRGPVPVRVLGPAIPPLPEFAGALHSTAAIEAGAAGVATLNAAPESGIVRSLPLMARTGATIWPTLSLELLRVATESRALGILTGPDGMTGVVVADAVVPSDARGRLWIRYAPSDPSRIVSAAAMLQDQTEPDLLRDRIVLIGFTALGLLDVVTTPLGDHRPGVEVHAEAIENILAGATLRRPVWMSRVELALYAVLAAIAVLGVPRLRTRTALGLFAVLLPAVAAAGIAAFLRAGLLVDVATPLLGASGVLAAMLTLSLTESERQRRRMAHELAVARERQARIAGELEAARRIQIGLLPRVGLDFVADGRFAIAARMLPARSVGGDLYDFFLLDPDRLFVAIGDVTGKGVSASLFMAIAKALMKSSAYHEADRADTGDALAAVIERAHADIARESAHIARTNPGDAPFVTLACFILDLTTGSIDWLNAGHELPLRVRAGAVGQLRGRGGPPLCVIEDYAYPMERDRLEPGDLLVLVTDGVTEAVDDRDQLYGRDRLERAVATLPEQASPEEVIATLLRDVDAFASGAELPDDMAIVAVRWLGSGACREISGR